MLNVPFIEVLKSDRTTLTTFIPKTQTKVVFESCTVKMYAALKGDFILHFNAPVLIYFFKRNLKTVC